MISVRAKRITHLIIPACLVIFIVYFPGQSTKEPPKLLIRSQNFDSLLLNNFTQAEKKSSEEKVDLNITEIPTTFHKLKQITEKHEQSDSISSLDSDFSNLLSTMTHDNLSPLKQLGSLENSPKYVIGIPTVLRQSKGTEYLLSTLTGLVTGIKNISPNKIKILVVIGETDKTAADIIFNDVQMKFTNEINDQIITIIQPRPSFYPDITYSKDVYFGDSIERQKWRTKQNLDYIYLWYHSLNLKSDYFLQLEDDIFVQANWFDVISQNIQGLAVQDWAMIHFTNIGFIGKLFKHQTLYELMIYAMLELTNIPCDWILDYYLTTKFCPHLNPMSNAKFNENKNLCEQQMKIHAPTRVGTVIFSHAGKFSSLNGQIRETKKSQKPKKVNEPQAYVKTEKQKQHGQSSKARLYTNFIDYLRPDIDDSNYKINQVYKNEATFHSIRHKSGDYIYIIFEELKNSIKNIEFDTGGENYKNDILKAEVNLLISDKVINDDKLEGVNRAKIGSFENGTFKKNDLIVENIAGIEILVKEESEFWVFIQNIYII